MNCNSSLIIQSISLNTNWCLHISSTWSPLVDVVMLHIYCINSFHWQKSRRYFSVALSFFTFLLSLDLNMYRFSQCYWCAFFHEKEKSYFSHIFPDIWQEIASLPLLVLSCRSEICRNKNMNGEKWKREAEILVILLYFRHFSIVCSASAISACQYLSTTLLFRSLMWVKKELKIAINENWSARAETVATMDRQCLLCTRLQFHSIPSFNSFSFSLLKWK